MADRIIKPDSGNDVVIQNNGGTRKIEVTNTGDVEVTGDFKATTVKATNLKANDGTASLEIADSSGDIGFSGNTNLKIKLPSAGGLYESDGSTEILTESSGSVSLKNTTIDSTAIFPAGHSVQVVSSTQTGEVTFLTSTPTAVSNLTKSITLKTNAPKILVILAINSGGKALSNTALGINLTADSDTALNIQLSDILGWTNDTGISFGSAVQVYLHELTSNDTAGDTITYTPKFFSAAASTQAAINGAYSTDDATSQIILMELTT